MSRAKTDQLIMKRILIILIVCSVLIVLMVIVLIRKWGLKRSGQPNIEAELEELMNERQQMLKQAIFAQNGNIRR